MLSAQNLKKGTENGVRPFPRACWWTVELWEHLHCSQMRYIPLLPPVLNAVPQELQATSLQAGCDPLVVS